MGFHAGCRVKSQRFGKFCKSSGKYKPKTYKLKLVLHRKLIGGAVAGDVVHQKNTKIGFGNGGDGGTVDSHKNHTSVVECEVLGSSETFEKSEVEIITSDKRIYETYAREYRYTTTIQCLSNKKKIIINMIEYYAELMSIVQV